jgi:SET domain-containing protein
MSGTSRTFFKLLEYHARPVQFEIVWLMSNPPIVVRRSKVHGLGVFATRAIRKGEVIEEYVGERISHAEANWRYRHRDINDSHTFLFTVSSRTVIDARRKGNDTRYINHRCDPNCEAQIRRGRVFIVAIRNIWPGDELGFEYNIGREDDDPPNVDDIYACRCGARRCRGTILWPPKRPRAAGDARTA